VSGNYCYIQDANGQWVPYIPSQGQPWDLSYHTYIFDSSYTTPTREPKVARPDYTVTKVTDEDEDA
jgi:hypothetical protein